MIIKKNGYYGKVSELNGLTHSSDIDFAALNQLHRIVKGMKVHNSSSYNNAVKYYNEADKILAKIRSQIKSVNDEIRTKMQKVSDLNFKKRKSTTPASVVKEYERQISILNNQIKALRGGKTDAQRNREYDMAVAKASDIKRTVNKLIGGYSDRIHYENKKQRLGKNITAKSKSSTGKSKEYMEESRYNSQNNRY